ncbi:8155_t:CDS:1 [Paraglomus occultum]|uniref:8155_t:CDS:1 n=1 Tax=Paraglomus occultum TaxID=144539 RepID=A0A9N9BA12_9GLOM|nr:8155_t:CDS:1 [Paraglomus occultum]
MEYEWKDMEVELRKAGITAPLDWFKGITYEEFSILLNPPYNLSMSFEELFAPSKKRRDRKTPPRPLNSWIIFNRDYTVKCKHSDEASSKDGRRLAATASKVWKEKMQEDTEYFNILSKIAENVHNIMYPDYRYDPSCKKEKFRKKKTCAGSTQKRKCVAATNTMRKETGEENADNSKLLNNDIDIGTNINTSNISQDIAVPSIDGNNDWIPCPYLYYLDINEPPSDSEYLDAANKDAIDALFVDITSSPDSNAYFTPHNSPIIDQSEEYNLPLSRDGFTGYLSWFQSDEFMENPFFGSQQQYL